MRAPTSEGAGSAAAACIQQCTQNLKKVNRHAKTQELVRDWHTFHAHAIKNDKQHTGDTGSGKISRKMLASMMRRTSVRRKESGRSERDNAYWDNALASSTRSE